MLDAGDARIHQDLWGQEALTAHLYHLAIGQFVLPESQQNYFSCTQVSSAIFLSITISPDTKQNFSLISLTI